MYILYYYKFSECTSTWWPTSPFIVPLIDFDSFMQHNKSYKSIEPTLEQGAKRLNDNESGWGML